MGNEGGWIWSNHTICIYGNVMMKHITLYNYTRIKTWKNKKVYTTETKTAYLAVSQKEHCDFQAEFVCLKDLHNHDT
jgi:hypothetical protein